MDDLRPLPIGETSRLLVLTGAGISAESGIPTFRGAGGLWNGENPDAVASPRAFRTDPDRVWRFHALLRSQAAAAAPNPAHLALAAAAGRLGDRLLLVTQNIDGLHARAGSAALEFHGSIWRTRCTGCDRPAFPDTRTDITTTPVCELCGGRLRPDVVWFDELIEPAHVTRIRHFIRDARRARAPLALLAVGTSGAVWPANQLASWVRDARGAAWLVNLEAPENAYDFHRVFTGPAGALLPRLLGVG